MDDEGVFPFEISAATSFLELHHGEVGDSWVEFDLFDVASAHVPRVRVTFRRCVAVRSDWTAYEGRSGCGLVHDSAWIRDLNAWQRRNYPDYPDNFVNMQHYFFAGHDEAVEVLAEGHVWHYVREPRGSAG